MHAVYLVRTDHRHLTRVSCFRYALLHLVLVWNTQRDWVMWESCSGLYSHSVIQSETDRDRQTKTERSHRTKDNFVHKWDNCINITIIHNKWRQVGVIYAAMCFLHGPSCHEPDQAFSTERTAANCQCIRSCWILTSHQPRRVTSGKNHIFKILLRKFKKQVTELQVKSWITT